MATTQTFATIDERDIITSLTTCATDEQAQEWYRTSARGGRLVVLDLSAAERPEVGNAVSVDDVGVATLL